VEPETGKLGKPPAGPFVLHLHGVWGSGKSSLLTFLEQDLRRPNAPERDGKQPVPWIVVWFKPWEHQRLAPPWLWLMAIVSRKASRRLCQDAEWRRAKWPWVRFEAAVTWWRVKPGWRNLLGLVLGLAVLAGVSMVVLFVIKNHQNHYDWF